MSLENELINTLQPIYSEWLINNYPDEIHTSEDHIKAEENMLHWNTFIEECINLLNNM